MNTKQIIRLSDLVIKLFWSVLLYLLYHLCFMKENFFIKLKIVKKKQGLFLDVDRAEKIKFLKLEKIKKRKNDDQ